MSTAKKTVTYLGPEAEGEIGDYLVVNGVRLPLDAEVSVDAETASMAEKAEGHKVKVGSAKAGDEVPEAQANVNNPEPPEGGATGADAESQE